MSQKATILLLTISVIVNNMSQKATILLLTISVILNNMSQKATILLLTTSVILPAMSVLKSGNKVIVSCILCQFDMLFKFVYVICTYLLLCAFYFLHLDLYIRMYDFHGPIVAKINAILFYYILFCYLSSAVEAMKQSNWTGVRWGWTCWTISARYFINSKMISFRKQVCRLSHPRTTTISRIDST